MPTLNSPTLSGDVSGTIYSVNVNKIKGVSIASTAPLTNQTLVYNGTQWAPSSSLSGTVATFSVSVSALSLSSASAIFQNDITVNGLTIGRGAGNLLLGNTNLAVGFLTLSQNTSSENTAIGGYALRGNTSGTRNTSLGHVAGYSITTGSFNTAIGAQSLYYNVTGRGNTAVGDAAGFAISGSGNVLLGQQAGSSITSGSNNTIIGSHDGGAASLSDTIIIAAGSRERIRVNSSGTMTVQGSLSAAYISAPFINSSSDPFANEVTLNLMTNYIDGNNSVFLNLATTPSNPLISHSGPSVYTSGITRPGGGATSLRIFGSADIGTRSMLYDTDAVSLSAFNFGNNNYTIEGWIYPTQTGKVLWLADTRLQGTTDDGRDYLVLQTNTSLRPSLAHRSAGVATSTSFSDLTLTLSAWSHVCYQRTGNTIHCFVNGVPSSTTGVAGAQVTNNGFTIGNAANFFFGDSSSAGFALDFFRVTRNVARYPITGFTPPATNIQEPSSQTPIRFSAPIAAPALSGAHFGDGSNLTGIAGGSARLALSGGTLTGGLTGTTARFTDNIRMTAGSRLFLADTNNDTSIVRDAGNSGIALDTASITRLFIGDTGNVGIGTTSPVTKVHVVGNSRLQGDVTITGNLSCAGTQTFTNTVFTTTSAVSVVNFGSGAALYVGNNGPGDIASFYDIDQNIEVLHVGGNNGTFPNVGVKTSSPNKTLTVAGEISATQDITTTGNFVGVRATLTSSISAPALSGAFFGDGSRLTGVGGGTANALPLSGGTMTGPLNLVTTTETKATPSIASSALSLDLATATFFSVTVNSAVTFTFANTPASPRVYSFMLQLIGDGTARTITWPGTVRWGGGVPPIVTSTLNKVDTYSFLTHDGGTNWFGFIVDQNS
jgi:hypothetical protein